MNARDFCYWLQGFFELMPSSENPVGLNAKQADIIKKHLSLVFKHEIDPSFIEQSKYSLIKNDSYQEVLNQLHGGDKPTKIRC